MRPAVEALGSYRPGKAAEQAEQDHGISGAVKLASNENPYAPVAAITAAVTSAARNANRYSDHRATAVREALADRLGVAVDRVAVGAGSAALLYQLATAYLDPGDEAVTPWVSFEAYPIAVQTMGATLVRVPLNEDWTFDLDAVAAAVSEYTKLVFLATPNNPTGTALSTAQIRSLVQQMPEDVVVMVDEAYREFSDPTLGDPVAELHDLRNVVVTRTFSKAYGMAGLRIGYAMGDPEVIAAIDKCLIAFSVNGLAQAAALAALSDEAAAQVAANIATILAERSRVVAALEAQGWAIPAPQANFVWIPCGDQADDLSLQLERQGVVTRPFTGLGIRVSIGSPSENDRFLAELSAIRQPSGG